jgi:hypothetical protein
MSVMLPSGPLSRMGNPVKLSQAVIASAAKQSLSLVRLLRRLPLLSMRLLLPFSGSF